MRQDHTSWCIALLLIQRIRYYLAVTGISQAEPSTLTCPSRALATTDHAGYNGVT